MRFRIAALLLPAMIVSQAFAGSVVFRPVALTDAPNMIGGEAYRLLIPAGWQFQGSMVWRNNPANPASPKLRVLDPAGTSEIGLMPDIPFYWNPGTLAYFPPGSSYLGNEVRQPVLDATAAIRTIILPRYWPKLQGARVVKQEALPDLAASGALKYPELNGRATFHAGKVRLEFQEGKTTVQMDVYCLIGAVQVPVAGMTSTLWGIEEIRYSKAAAGQLDDQYKTFRVVHQSLRPNLRWFARYQQLVQILVQNQMDASNRAADLSRYISRTNDQITASIRQSYENRQAAMDRVNDRFDRYIRSVDAYHDPLSGNNVELPSGYGQAWSNASGEYILSDSPNFNPNVGSNLGWQKMTKQ